MILKLEKRDKQDDIEVLINACSQGVDELVIDLSSQIDERINKIFDIADMILLVCDSTSTSQNKMKQFVTQHNLYGKIQNKVTYVNNKGAKTIEGIDIDRVVSLPLVQTTDPISIYKTLSGVRYE